MSAKILFISHAASRTGAPILLLQFLKWLKANSDVEFNILVSVPGPLLPEFEALAETYVMYQPLSIPERLFRKLIGRSRWIRIKNERLKSWCRRNDCVVIYANTIVPCTGEMEVFSSGRLPGHLSCPRTGLRDSCNRRLRCFSQKYFIDQTFYRWIERSSGLFNGPLANLTIKSQHRPHIYFAD